jgi:hypothetical protein
MYSCTLVDEELKQVAVSYCTCNATLAFFVPGLHVPTSSHMYPCGISMERSHIVLHTHGYVQRAVATVILCLQVSVLRDEVLHGQGCMPPMQTLGQMM